MRKKYALLLVSSLLLPACQSSFGPDGLNNTHPAYNQSIINTLNQQMLLNLVRLKYMDEPYFLTISSVTASLGFGHSIGIGNSNVDFGVGPGSIAPNIGFTYNDSPTLSYQPLYGADFLKSVLSPIPLDSLLVMTQSGWSLKRIFSLCVERINHIPNAHRASGPTPKVEPEFQQFKQVLSVMEEIQAKGKIEMGLDGLASKDLVILFEAPKHPELLSKLARLLNTHAPANGKLYIKVGSNFLKTDPDQVALRSRSISSLLFYLSQNVEIPKEDIDKGLVTETATKTGGKFNWSDTPAGGLFKVKVSESYPDGAFLAVNYRDHWFYIADNDLNTKASFMLLVQLFDLQAGQTTSTGPTLTLPIR
jgi:hypothetical protein